MIVAGIKPYIFNKSTQHKPSFGASWDLYITKMVMDARKCKDKGLLDSLPRDINILRVTSPNCRLCRPNNADMVTLEDKNSKLSPFPICRISKKTDPLSCAKNVHKIAKVLIG